MEKLFVKNMVCDRCILTVQTVLSDLKIQSLSVKLGEVNLQEALATPQKQHLNTQLKKLGFEIISSKKDRIVEQMRKTVIEWVQGEQFPENRKISRYFSELFQMEYSALSKMFSEVQGVSLEQYLIAQKVERVKELLTYQELSLSEMAFKLNYSSLAHLSKQFKKVTGKTPTEYKLSKIKDRTALDQV